MKEFKKFPSIEQYRNAVKKVQEYIEWADIEDADPIINVIGTVKLHGTNACIGYDPTTGEIWAQSRNNIITPEKDNAGFASWVHKNRDYFSEVLSVLNGVCYESVYIFGEWCGGNIQKNVGITGLDKMFVIFSIYIDGRLHRSECNDFADDFRQSPYINNVYSIYEFPTWSLDINFNKPDLWIDDLTEITQSVEDECPVAKAFGVDNGVGEGVVWTGYVKGLPFRFKVKGAKHSSSKVKQLASVDVEKLKSIESFADYVLTDSRLNQAVDEIGGADNVGKGDTGHFVRWIANDVIKEESDTLSGNGLSWKEVAKTVSIRASKWFISNHG